MKTAALALAIGLAVGAAGEPGAAQAPRPPVKASLAQIAWLVGDWRGTTGKMTFEERWTGAAGGVMLAVARTLEGDALAGFEFLRIVERDGTLVYVAQPNGRPPTEFVLAAIAADAATFENPAHDFPKKVRYTLRGDRLEAVVSDGGSKAETFTFSRQR